TTQIINRLKRHFGDKVGIYHSRFNQNERVEIWNRVLYPSQVSYDIILGARSAVFLPVQDLGLVIVDEEHEGSFKQYDPAPRYHARDAAIVLANMQGAKVLLGSATPAVETTYNAEVGKFGRVMLTKRYGGGQLPEILVADVRKAQRRKEMKSLFSPMLLEAMEKAFEQDEQVILFQNRRGFSPYVICEDCGWNPECQRCDVGLTYHKYQQRLRCHYCGFAQPMPKTCLACGSNRLTLQGFGTEKIEEELAIFFPDIKVARMDLDTTRSRHSYQRIIHEFESRVIDVLVGTQMVTKGLDFDNVGLVGIMSADSLLSFPDFRAFERSYQLMTQVAGRAGRSQKRGKVIIQTYNPHHRVIRQVVDHDYEALYKDEILERRNFHYPPFHRMIRITLKHRDVEKVNHAAAYLARLLRTVFGERVLGPEFPLVARMRN
ncbi:MAG: primosomal protein N', partial [Bacteroidota bacterium]